MKRIAKYYSLILISILSVKTLIDYFQYREDLKKIEVDEMPIDTWFGGWSLVFLFLMICLLEISLKNQTLKLIIRIYLTIIIIGILLVNTINIDNLYAGIANTVTVTGIISVFFLVVKKIVPKIEKASS